MRRSFSVFVTLLIVYFVWSAFSTVKVLLQGTSVDQAIWETVGYGGRFQLVVFVHFLVCVAAAALTVWPRAVGFWVAVAEPVMAAIYNVVAGVIALGHLPELRSYVDARFRARGGDIDPEVIDLIVSPPLLQAFIVGSALFHVLVIVVLVLNRTHYRGAESNRPRSSGAPVNTSSARRR
jgi:hypothetical protein